MSGDDQQRELHTSRLMMSREEIADLENQSTESPAFREWQSRIGHSLTVLFGKESSYVGRFRGLRYSEGVMRPYGARPGPTRGDTIEYRNSLQRARSILTEALEELPMLPSKPVAGERERPASTPQIVLVVNNTLSQFTVVSFSQIMEAVDTLPSAQIEEAKAAAEEFQKEAAGQQRWPVLAQAVDKLQKLGTEAYKRVAVPLILEYLKKQAGL
jgi:hypothetical protein